MLPIKISPCPIIESKIEIRFTPNFPPDAVVGVAYNLLSQNGVCTLIQLPIMQLPADIRSKDPQFKYQPTHTITNQDIFVHVGPNVAIIQIPSLDYPGWQVFREKINGIVSTLCTSNLIREIGYIGLRYINFFPNINIFDKIKLRIEGLAQKGRSTIFRTELDNKNFTNVLQISDGVHVKNTRQDCDGSLIDITTVTLPQHGLTLDNSMSHIDKIRAGEKELFFSLLKQDFLDSLSPEYE